MNRKTARRCKVTTGKEHLASKGKVKNSKLGPDGLPRITENDVKDECKDLLDGQGIFNYHNLQGMGSYPGTPDIVAILPVSVEKLLKVAQERDIQTVGLYLGIEAKSPTGSQSDKQKGFQRRVDFANGLYLLVDNPEQLAEFLEVKDFKPWRGKRLRKKKRARY